MAVRNYWISGKIDGRQTRLEGGPQSKEGGFELNVYMRNDGEVTLPVRVWGFAKADGTLRLEVLGAAGETLYEIVTQR